MNWKKRNIANFSTLLPLDVLRKGIRTPFLPFYHFISDEKIDHIKSYEVLSVKAFEEELDYMLQHFEAVELQDIVEHPSERKMHISFDDGLKECSDLIAPILKRKGVPATFFVNPGFVDNKAIFHRFRFTGLQSAGIELPEKLSKFYYDSALMDKLLSENEIDLQNMKPYMSLSDLHGLHRDGFIIGAHSWDHPEMWMMDESGQMEQIQKSVDWVKEHFQQDLSVFSFPFTDDQISQSLFDRIQDLKIVDYTFGTAGLKPDEIGNHFQRVPMEVSGKTSKKIKFEYLYHRIRQIVKANVVLHP